MEYLDPRRVNMHFEMPLAELIMRCLPALGELLALLHHRVWLEELQSWSALAAEARALQPAATATGRRGGRGRA